METLVIVGASLAGLSAARAARRQGFAGQLVIVGEDPQRPYDRPPLSKEFLSGQFQIQDISLEIEDEQLDAEWVLGVRAESFHSETRIVTLSDGRTIYADYLVIATGANARQLPELVGLENVVTLRTLEDATALQSLVQRGGKMVVLGAGFIGAEVASTARDLGMDVTVLERSATPLCRQLGHEVATLVAKLHAKAGVELICGAEVESFGTDSKTVTEVRLAGGRVLPADVLLVGIGAQPNVGWLEGSGVELGDGVVCDAAGRTNVPGVVAVGDCASWLDLRSGQHRRVEHWTGAQSRPAVAVGALLGHDDALLPVEQPYFWSCQYGARLQFVGDASVADHVVYEHGEPEEGNFLAVYYAGQNPVAVLGWNQPKLFTRWRKFLAKAPLPGVEQSLVA